MTRTESTEWVGGRMATPLFCEDDGGYQLDVIVWLDPTRDVVVGVDFVPPSAPDARLAEVLRKALRRPLAGPRRPPSRIRVASAQLAALLSPVAGAVPIVVAPTPEVVSFVDHIGDDLLEENPELVALQQLLRAERATMARVLPVMARLFRAGPWHLLPEASAMRLDVPELGVEDWCISVTGQDLQRCGLVLLRSAADHVAYYVDSDGNEGALPDDIGPETLALSYAAVGELPVSFCRELAALGWDLANLDVYPMWFYAPPRGQPRIATVPELRILLAAAGGVLEHLARYHDALAAHPVVACTGEYSVDTGAGVVTARITSPHPEVPWARDRGPKPERLSSGTARSKGTRGEG